MKPYIFIVSFIRISFACLPTQQVEMTTTTVAPYPCSVCQPIYSDDCFGGAFACALSSAIGIVYQKGPLLNFGYGDADTCSTFFTCPLPTTSRIRLPITNTVIPGPNIVVAVCQETGANAGTWYYGTPPIITPAEMVGTTCQGILSG